MSENWPTKAVDLAIAFELIEAYADKNNLQSLSLFELIVNLKKKRINFRIADWVMILASWYRKIYGDEQGNFVICKVISNCIVNGETVH